MLYRSTEHWEKSEDRSLLVFFAQRMDELAFEYTLDSHRPPTTTPPTLVSECIDALKYCLKNEKALPGALHLLDELETRLHSNIVAQGLLSIGVDRFFKLDRTSPTEMLKVLLVLAGQLKPYPYAVECFRLTQEILQTPGANRKKDIDFLCREMIASLVNLGLSTRWIHRTVLKFFFEDPVPEKFDLRTFWKEIFPHEHLFYVMTPIDSKAHLLDDMYLKAFGTKIVSVDELEEHKADLEDLCGKDFKHVAITDKVKAKDPFAAVEIANQKIARLHHVYGLFNHKHNLISGDRSFVVQRCCAANSGAFANVSNRMQFVRDKLPNPAARAMESMMKRVRLPSGPDRKKFFNAVSFHGMSNQSSSIENQLVNIWTALETITPEGHSGSTISNVTKGVLPFVGINYMSRLTRCLLGDLLRWNRGRTFKSVKAAACNEGDNLLLQFFCLLTLKENETILADLFDSLGDFHLLRYRAFSLHSTLKSRTKTLKAVEDHERRVIWQLHRIYRTRNLIVHRGQLPSFTKTLVVNAHDYFDQVFELTCHLGGGDQFYDNYEDCFRYMEMRYKMYKDELVGEELISAADAQVVLWMPPQDSDHKSLLPD